MEKGAALAVEGDLLTIYPTSDTYVRYLSDNRGVVADLARDFFGQPMKVELASGGAAPPPAPEAPSTPAEATSPGIVATRSENGQPHSTEGLIKTVTSSADERAEIYSDPEMRRIFDAFEARLVEIRAPRGKASE